MEILQKLNKNIKRDFFFVSKKKRALSEWISEMENYSIDIFYNNICRGDYRANNYLLSSLKFKFQVVDILATSLEGIISTGGGGSLECREDMGNFGLIIRRQNIYGWRRVIEIQVIAGRRNIDFNVSTIIIPKINFF